MPRLLVIDDDPMVPLMVKKAFATSDVEVESAGSGAEGVEVANRFRPDVALVDIRLPDRSGLELFGDLRRLDSRMPVVFITASGTSSTAIEAMKLGAYDYLHKPIDLPAVREILARAFAVRRLMSVPVAIGDASGVAPGSDSLIGQGDAMREVYKGIGRVAAQDVTVLIRGESGTGKELIARAIYQHSRRAARPFLAINCAAIPEALLESELFGHERGAFTGADRQRVGKFEQCAGGTLLLDEIGDMPPLLQAKLLRVIQERRFERVGGNETIRADVRILAATHRNLEEAIAAGQFRADLYYRLNIFTITVPPLRSRLEDLPALIDHFLGRFRRELSSHVDKLSPDAIDALRRHSWPGNVRELQSILKQAMLHAAAGILIASDLAIPPALRSGGMPTPASGTYLEEAIADFLRVRIAENSQNLHAELLDVMERHLIAQVLRHTDGNQVHAARVLGIARNSLRKKIGRFGITIDRVIEC